MKHLLIHTNTNTLIGTLGGSATPRFKRDGDEFTREAGLYKEFHESQGDQVFQFGVAANKPFKDRLWDFSRIIGDYIRTEKTADTLVYFGHGYPSGIQLGFKWKHGADLMVRNMIGMEAKTLVLYACSCGKGKDNFMIWIAEGLIKNGVKDFKIFGHDRKGHVTRNPNVICYVPETILINKERIGQHNEMIRQPKRIEFKKIMSPDAWKSWIKALEGNERFQFPFMGIEENKRWI